MGKRLIFKGENFTDTSFIVKNPTWEMGYTDSQLNGGTTVTSGKTWYMKPTEISSLNLTGKTIYYVKMYAATAGNVTISLVNTNGDGSIVSRNTYSVVQGVNTITLINSIIFTTNRSIGFSGNGIVTLKNDGSVGWQFLSVDSATSYDPKTIPIDLGTL